MSATKLQFRSDAELQDRIRFEMLLADLSARFVNLTADQVDCEIRDAQRRICQCLALEHASVWQCSDNKPDKFLLTHLYRDPGLPPLPDLMDADTYFPWSLQKAKRKEIICITRSADLPPEAGTDKGSWQSFRVKSTLAFPLWTGEDPIFGALAFDSIKEEREWPEALVQRLQLLAQVFANALARQRIERALNESQTRLILAAASADAGLWTLDTISGQFWTTDKNKELLGVATTEEFDVKKFLNLVHPEDREAVNHTIEEAMESGEERSIEYRIIRPDGQIRWISARGRRRSNNFGKSDQLMGVSIDVTERKLAEEAILRHSAILQSSNDAIISVNLQGIITDWNDAARRMYGFTQEDALGKSVALIIPPELQDEESVILDRLKKGERIEHYETVRTTKDGRRVNVSLTLSPLNDSAGRLIGVSKTARDITESIRAQAELQRAYAEVKQLKDRLQTESDYLQEEIKHIGRYDEIVGQSEPLREVLRKVEQVASTDSLVLITGETGTGKELIARAIHNLSKRKARVMVKVDCAALPGSLIESELFGREKGAYTGALSTQIGRVETADGSTLFLDEIGELGVELQAKLLRIVQDGEFERLGSARTIHVDVRVIAATHRDLAEGVKNETFREDLFYRLNVFPIRVPPLRERSEDIPLLVTESVREFERKMGKKIRIIPRNTMEELKRYPWPGNIRELRNVIERAVILTTGEKLEVQLPKMVNPAITRTLREAEYQHICSVLEKTGWRIKGPNGAAMILGMKPSTLYTAMRRLRISTRHERGGIRSPRRNPDLL